MAHTPRQPSILGGFVNFIAVMLLIVLVVLGIDFVQWLRDDRRANDYTQADVDCSEARAQPILDAIHAYRAARGVYPPSLEAVAAFAGITIPTCCMNDVPYLYSVSDDATSFTLTFAASDTYYPRWYWTSDKGVWYADW